MQWLDLLQWLIVPLAALAWLLAAQRALTAMQELAASGGVNVSGSTMISYKFRLAFSQVGVPLAVMTTYLVVMDLRFGVSLFGTEYWSLGDTLQVIAMAVGGAILVFTEFACLAALLAAPNLPKLVLTLWFMARYGGWLGSLVFFSAMNLGVSIPFQATAPMASLVVDDVAAALGIAGFGLLLLTLHLLALNRAAGLRLAAGIGVLGVLSAFGVGLGSDPGNPGSVPYVIDYVLVHLYRIPNFQPPLGASVIEDSGLELWFYVFDYGFMYKLSTWLFWIVWPIQAAIAAGYIWLIHFVITTGARGTSPKSAEG